MQQQIVPYRSDAYKFSSYFIYQVSFLENLAPGQTENLNFTVNADSDFLWQKSAGYAQVGSASAEAATRPVPSVTLFIQDQSNGRYFSNQPVPMPAIVGTGELPFILPDAALLTATAQLTIQISNVGDDTYSQFYLNFIGKKCYR